MRKDLFEKLTESIREAGRIRRTEQQPTRRFAFASASDMRAIREGHEVEILPNEGTTDIRLGVRREAVRATFAEAQPTEKPSDSGVPSDVFAAIGLVVHYDSRFEVEAIEIASPAMPTLFSRPIIGEPFEKVAAWLSGIDDSVEVDGAGLTSMNLGIGLYAPHAAKSPDDPVESVIVFRRGYYG